MYPRVELGPLTIYTYGLMLAVGLAVGIGLLCLELRRKGHDPGPVSYTHLTLPTNREV